MTEPFRPFARLLQLSIVLALLTTPALSLAEEHPTAPEPEEEGDKPEMYEGEVIRVGLKSFRVRYDDDNTEETVNPAKRKVVKLPRAE